MKNWPIIALLALVLLGGCATRNASAMADDKRVYVVRHLHKALGDDPPLSPEGTAAAQRLADVLADRGIAAIYATPTRRAMATAQPLARRMGLAITPYDPRDPEALAAIVAASAQSVMVVGHSNTVPDLIARFGGRPVPTMTEEDYGEVFVIQPGGMVREFTLD